jgi:homoserine O-acetyltransferase/O-succinyltransferase
VGIDAALFQENERTSPDAGERRYLNIGHLALDLGGSLPDVVVCYETWGTLNADCSNAVLVCHALSGDSHCVGWWDRLVGPGRAIDTNHQFVICANALGGCQGSTGPTSLAWDEQPYASQFPRITVGDMVAAQARLLDHLGIECLLAVAGGSMGGMQALEWTVRFPSRVRKAFVTASAAAHSAMQIGFNEVARQAIKRDPKWRGGDYANDPPVNGLSVARMLGHLSFLSGEAFTQKFGRRLQEGKDGQFQVESYLNYQCDKFTSRFDANSLLVLTDAIDRYELTSLEGATAEFLFVSFSTDWLYTPSQSEDLMRMAEQAGVSARYENIDLPYGHDSFLLDGELQGAAVREFLGE